VANLSRPFVCAVCGKQMPWGDMEKHVMYTGDPKHEKWRVDHHLPEKVPFGTLKKFGRTARFAIVREFSQ